MIANQIWYQYFLNSVALVLLVPACQAPIPGNSPPTRYPEPTRLLAVTYGPLKWQEGCAAVVGDFTTYTLAWPPDFEVRVEGEALQVVRADGVMVELPFGEEIYVSGGEVYSRRALSDPVQAALPPQCPSPFWVVGDYVVPLDEAEVPGPWTAMRGRRPMKR